MARATCTKCGGPREFDSSNLSRCKECTREYHRNRYRDQRKQMGFSVMPRIVTSTTEPTQLAQAKEQEAHETYVGVLDSQSKGEVEFVVCVICHGRAKPALPITKPINVVNHKNTTTTSHFEKNPNIIVALVCENCYTLASAVFDANLARAIKVIHFISSVTDTKNTKDEEEAYQWR